MCAGERGVYGKGRGKGSKERGGGIDSGRVGKIRRINEVGN